MSKHTPGPWRYVGSQSKEAFNVIGTVLGGKYKIARCPYVLQKGEQFTTHNSRQVLEAEANARLISTSPEMYKLLQEIDIYELSITSPSLANRIESLLNRIDK